MTISGIFYFICTNQQLLLLPWGSSSGCGEAAATKSVFETVLFNVVVFQRVWVNWRCMTNLVPPSSSKLVLPSFSGRQICRPALLNSALPSKARNIHRPDKTKSSAVEELSLLGDKRYQCIWCVLWSLRTCTVRQFNNWHVPYLEYFAECGRTSLKKMICQHCKVNRKMYCVGYQHLTIHAWDEAWTYTYYVFTLH